jgi:ribonuclease J
MDRADELEAIPLGGLGEFGLNMMIYRCRKQIIVVDAGLMFPEDDLMGVDIVVPDISYLFEHRDEIMGYIVTHGHEDHIGALPFILGQCPAPVYATKLTIELIATKLKEHKLLDETELVEVSPREVLELPPFLIEFLRVPHSMADTVALAVRTPAGTVVHTGDFKFDQTPPDGEKADYARLSRYGEEGVLALFSDSTNSERPGITPSERSLRSGFDNLFHRATGKVIVSCFASSTHRVQLAMDMAHQNGRKLALVGRSMLSNVQIAHRLGYLQVPPNLLIDDEQCSDYPARQIAVLATGSQGEPRAGLARIALENHRNIRIEKNDTVILSARVIPGNDRMISNMVNHLHRHGAHVYGESHPGVHVSGHASSEELKLMINLTQPRYVIPIHGEISQLHGHARLAEEVDIPVERILIIQTGDIIAFHNGEAGISGRVEVGRRYIDEDYYGEVDHAVVRERRHLSEDGFVMAVVAINKGTGEIEGTPDIIARGYVLDQHFEAIREEVMECIVSEVESSNPEERTDPAILKDKIRKRIKRILFKSHQKKPMIIPVVVEI